MNLRPGSQSLTESKDQRSVACHGIGQIVKREEPSKKPARGQVKYKSASERVEDPLWNFARLDDT